MKTKLLPLIAAVAVSVSAGVQAGNISAKGMKAYAVDSNGNIVRDNYGACVKSIHWTKDAAIDSCKGGSGKGEKKQMKKQKQKMAAAAPVAMFIPEKGPIMGTETNAYVIDSDGEIVRDSWGRCVRTINWSPKTALAACEGGEKPAPVAKPLPVIKPAPIVEEPKIVPNVPVHFRGFFDTDSAKLKSAAFEDLDAYADYMNQMSDTNVKVTGHTDSTGSMKYNQGLSERRANAVKTYLQDKGISGDRIQAKGKGETQPIATNKTKDGRAQNRRVEVEIVK